MVSVPACRIRGLAVDARIEAAATRGAHTAHATPTFTHVSPPIDRVIANGSVAFTAGLPNPGSLIARWVDRVLFLG
jgi:hypothetical protein